MYIPDVAKCTLANLLVSKYVISANPAIIIALFQNNLTPVAGTVLADFTVATFSGHTNKTISNPATWLLATMSGGKARAVYGTNLQWLQSAITITNTIYGWYAYLDGVSITPVQQLLCCEKFDSPVAFNYVGQSVTITPQFELTLDPGP